MMRSAWGWPIAESLHFLGLCMLVGCIGTFDLRLLGVARRVPIATVHRFIPWGIAGFAINATTGALFLLTEPDQYIYNVSFHLKLLFLTIGGTNAGLFYLTSYRQAFGDAAALDAPRRAKGDRRGVVVCVDGSDCLRAPADVLPSRPLPQGRDQLAHGLLSAVGLPASGGSVHGRPYRKYSVGTTNMFSSVDVVSPHRITIAIGV